MVISIITQVFFQTIKSPQPWVPQYHRDGNSTFWLYNEHPLNQVSSLQAYIDRILKVTLYDQFVQIIETLTLKRNRAL